MDTAEPPLTGTRRLMQRPSPDARQSQRHYNHYNLDKKGEGVYTLLGVTARFGPVVEEYAGEME
jgi:hypothetical protein